MDELQHKASVLIHALPYMRQFKGKRFVIKYGGNAMVDENLTKSVLSDIALLQYAGIQPVVIHGCGNKITKQMLREKLKPVFVSGLRYTDKRTMEIVKSVSARVNKEMRGYLKQYGCASIDCTKKLLHTVVKNKDLGLVGTITKVNKNIIIEALRNQMIPVVSCVGYGDGEVHNVNADTVATKIAQALSAEKLTILTDVDGVYKEGRLLSKLTTSQAKEYIESGIISKGMIPKVMACADAVESGVKKAHLINGTYKHALLLEIFTDRGIGTEIVPSEN